jgi:hypothetical protein
MPANAFTQICCCLHISRAARAQVEIAAVQTGQYMTFPFCDCVKWPSPYGLSPLAESYGNGTYCFRINVAPLDSGRYPGYCAQEADIYKIEVREVGTGPSRQPIVACMVRVLREAGQAARGNSSPHLKANTLVWESLSMSCWCTPSETWEQPPAALLTCRSST